MARIPLFGPSDDDIGALLRGLRSSGAASAPFAANVDVSNSSVLLDSAVGGLEAVRSATVTNSRQLVVGTDGLSAVIDVEPSDTEWRLTGQIVDCDDVYVVQVLDDSESELAIAVTDAFGDFELQFRGPCSHLVFASANREVFTSLALA